MSFSDRIKVDLYGQYNNNTEHAYSFPDKITNQYSFTGKTEWAAAITDPRAIFQSICHNGPCYQIFRHRNGFYYSYIERNIADSRSGLEMITILIPIDKVAAGDSILYTLRELRSILIQNRRFDDDLVRETISHVQESHSRNVFPPKSQVSNNGPMVTACRTYRNEEELFDIFSFLNQSTYATIDKLIIVSQNDVKESGLISRITSPIKRKYTVVPGANVTANVNEVSQGESLSITYSRYGYENMTRPVVVDPTQSDYYNISGNELKLYSPERLGVSFNKKLYIKVKASEGRDPDIHSVEAVFDGRIVDHFDENGLYVLVHENDIFSGSSAVLSVSAKGFEPMQVTVKLDNLQNNASIPPVELSPKTIPVPFRVTFGEMGLREFHLPTVEVPMKETDPLLAVLREKKEFFGYEAWQNGSGSYTIIIPNKQIRNIESKNEKRSSRKRVRYLLFSLLGFILALLLLLGGYALRNYEIIKIPGLYMHSNNEQPLHTYIQPQTASPDPQSSVLTANDGLSN